MKIYRPEGRCNVSGLNIRLARHSAVLSQEQLAAKLQLEGLNLSQKAISRIESGSRIVTDFELVFFSSVFGITVSELLASHEKPEPHIFTKEKKRREVF